MLKKRKGTATNYEPNSCQADCVFKKIYVDDDMVGTKLGTY